MTTALPPDLTEPFWPGISLCALGAQNRLKQSIWRLLATDSVAQENSSKAFKTTRYGAVPQAHPGGLEPPTLGLEELGLFLLYLHHLAVSLWRL